MTEFTREDFLHPEIAQQLSVVIMGQIGKPVLTPFTRLLAKDKKIFNTKLNEYIRSLGNDWRQTLQTDFNETCQLELFDTDNFFDAEKIVCPIGETEHILSEEQTKFQEDMKDPEKFKVWQEKLKEEILEAERKAEEEGRVHYFNKEIENTAE